MDLKIKKLVTAVKEKRERHGYSLRKLSELIGVSFSTLARIERLEGEPDNNTKIRLINWLGEDLAPLGLEVEHVSQVHFRAAKQIDSKTVEHLVKVANRVREKFSEENNGSC